VVVATAGFEEDPLDEGMARVAMTALSRAGRQAEALRLGQRHRVAVAEAGLEVGPVIVATERALIDPAPTSPRLGRVPPPFYGNRCIGRDAELTIAEQAIAEHRLTTVVGPGGVGKSRLAREVALHHPGWWCDLSVVPGDADLPAVVCSQLRIRPEQGASAEGAVVDALAHEAGLLVLDNCDELTRAAAELLRRLLSWCPAVNVLATSRQPLGVAGEKVIELTPLPVGAESAAADLLVERARAVTELTDADRPAVATIVARLDGLPLAIELAAGRLAVVGVDELMSHLEDRFELLSTTEPARPPRHRSLDSVVAGSWQQLGARTREVAGALGVFQGWFTVADATAVTDVGPAECAMAVDELRRVSLLQADGRRPSPRFRYLAPVREFVRTEVSGDGAVRPRQARHTSWVIDRLTAARTAHRGPAEAESVEAVEELRPDVLAALARADPASRSELLAPLAELLAVRATAEDARAFTDAVARDGVTDPWVLAGAAQAAFVSGDLERSGALCRDAEHAATAAGRDVPWVVRWLAGSVPLFTGDPGRSRQLLEEAVGAVADPWERIFLQSALAFSAANAGDDDAVELAAAAVGAARDLGNPTCLSWALCASGAALTEVDPAAALTDYEEALAQALAVANQVTAGVVRPRIAALRTRASADVVTRALVAGLEEWQRRGNRAHATELVATAIPVLAAANEHETVAALSGAVGDASGFHSSFPATGTASRPRSTRLGASSVPTASRPCAPRQLGWTSTPR
jgi:predicted ATPase